MRALRIGPTRAGCLVEKTAAQPGEAALDLLEVDDVGERQPACGSRVAGVVELHDQHRAVLRPGRPDSSERCGGVGVADAVGRRAAGGGAAMAASSVVRAGDVEGRRRWSAASDAGQRANRRPAARASATPPDDQSAGSGARVRRGAARRSRAHGKGTYSGRLLRPSRPAARRRSRRTRAGGLPASRRPPASGGAVRRRVARAASLWKPAGKRPPGRRRGEVVEQGRPSRSARTGRSPPGLVERRPQRARTGRSRRLAPVVVASVDCALWAASASRRLVAGSSRRECASSARPRRGERGASTGLRGGLQP